MRWLLLSALALILWGIGFGWLAWEAWQTYAAELPPGASGWDRDLLLENTDVLILMAMAIVPIPGLIILAGTAWFYRRILRSAEQIQD